MEARVKYRNTPGESISPYAISHDRRRTWEFMNDSFRDDYKMNGTADAFVGTGKDGTLFIGAMNLFPQDASPLQLKLEKEMTPGLLYNVIDLSASSDGGKTWTAPAQVMGQATPLEEYGPGVKPHFLGKPSYVRPSLITDRSTGTSYILGNGSGGDVLLDCPEATNDEGDPRHSRHAAWEGEGSCADRYGEREVRPETAAFFEYRSQKINFFKHSAQGDSH